MLRGIDNGLMLTDLDAAFFFIKNLGDVTPPPPNLIDTNDYRLSNPRNLIPGSVTNDSVALNAAISQSKLNLHNNAIPISWLGTGANQAAEGDLVQPVSGKDQPNGYASLGADGKLKPGSTPVSGTGTLHTIDIALPLGTLTTVQSTTGTVVSLTGYWDAQDSGTFFGNTSGAPAPPELEDNRVFPLALIPSLDASKFTSGTFLVTQIPMAVGVGVGHAPGLLPSPGSTDTDSSAQPDDYIGRDMKWHHMQTIVSIQPQLPPPSITVQSYYQGQVYIDITENFKDTNLFLRLTFPPVRLLRHPLPFNELLSLPLLLDPGTIVEAYAAKNGYTNSEVSTFIVPASTTG